MDLVADAADHLDGLAGRVLERVAQRDDGTNATDPDYRGDPNDDSNPDLSCACDVPAQHGGADFNSTPDVG